MNNNINPIPDFMLPQNNQVLTPMNNIEPSMINNSPLFSVPPVIEQPTLGQEPQIQTPTVDIPLFSPNGSIPNQEQNETVESTISNTEQSPVIEQPALVQELPIQTPMVDVPLFNPNATMPGADTTTENFQIVEPSIIDQPTVETTPVEIPVNAPVTVEPPQEESSLIEVQPTVDRLTELKDLLSANGFAFKTFSNETDNCIIIEIPKN